MPDRIERQQDEVLEKIQRLDAQILALTSELAQRLRADGDKPIEA